MDRLSVNQRHLAVDKSLQQLRDYVEGRNYAGYDPYDGQNSPLMPLLSLGTKAGRIAWTQLLRRLPVNIRPLLLIRPGLNPKALGLFLEGYVRLFQATGGESYRDKALGMLPLLSECRSEGIHGNGWGYNFPWQSRAFCLPRHTPTVVNSAFIGHALLDAGEAFDCREALDLAVPIQDFILQDLNRIAEGDTFCFSYTPADRYAVHNASLLGASLLIRLSKITGDAAAREAALRALAYSIKHQRPDGSWYYAENESSHWIDSFHTGFNLEAIRHFLRLGEATEYQAAYEKGVRYYAENFFLADGTPNYYHNKTYPIDIHAPAEAVVFFSSEPGYGDLAQRVMNWMLQNMADPGGYFYFRKGRYFTNRIPYMRWGQAWAFRGLAAYASSRCAEPTVA